MSRGAGLGWSDIRFRTRYHPTLARAFGSGFETASSPMRKRGTLVHNAIACDAWRCVPCLRCGLVSDLAIAQLQNSRVRLLFSIIYAAYHRKTQLSKASAGEQSQAIHEALDYGPGDPPYSRWLSITKICIRRTSTKQKKGESVSKPWRSGSTELLVLTKQAL